MEEQQFSTRIGYFIYGDQMDVSNTDSFLLQTVSINHSGHSQDKKLKRV
jgi:hypothetical protein